MLIKKMIMSSAILFLLVACSTDQQQTSKLTLAEMEAKASVITEDDSIEEEANKEQSQSEEKKSDQEQNKSEASVKEEDKQIEVEQDSSDISNVIKWDEFFDNEKQDTPSDKFWDLKGEEVVINGFMGEVLSLNGGWFLLIPEPGAECPFDNGDESYWNKIMIVFVEDKKDLRFTNGPLKVTGRLDVGVKVDESNYKTMFRLYDAKFERINN